LRKNFSSGHHNAPDRLELAAFAENPPSDGRKFQVPNEIRLRFEVCFGFGHFLTAKV
jgi:hypothetical protein